MRKPELCPHDRQGPSVVIPELTLGALLAQHPSFQLRKEKDCVEEIDLFMAQMAGTLDLGRTMTWALTTLPVQRRRKLDKFN